MGQAVGRSISVSAFSESENHWRYPEHPKVPVKLRTVKERAAVDGVRRASKKVRSGLILLSNHNRGS